MKDEEIKKALEMIGKKVYVIKECFDTRPYIKAITITSVEFYGSGDYIYADLKTANDGCFRSGWGGFYETREEAEKVMQERHGGIKSRNEPVKQCPICKGVPQIVEYSRKFQIECAECGLATKPTDYLKDAIRLWNDRVD